MSLKRKASFPTIASPDADSFMMERLTMDDSPKHLSSRTRKRFRDDRPEDKVVYENTLRWLFTAQQQQEPTAAPSADENMELEAPPSSEIVDPRQQTLHKFFQPSQTSSFQPRANHLNHHPHANSPSTDIFPQRPDYDMVSTVTSLSRDTSSPSSHGAGAGMDMDTDSGRDEPGQDIRKWMGGWMP
ncbi:hypothetical protein P170DRAFT_466828 [Aspergillus steynii IBT 23096]|uniref:Uncharacterized protein n=1 Tax=Aspergillus steynii IBT 23096 TaxID=1392250 RepID=A0A2I2FYB4_9EURO|nr:uncharacterized protein P170DRAFT_466828 [Aspergillus steynii IBT 23096]PLB45536.1 hypothetical protein P170DRAFT_466828 [Aspergillus steynii IBT 23096]